MEDIDGSELGKVQLLSVKLVDGFYDDTQLHNAYFEEVPGDKNDPFLMAHGLKLSIENDFPDHYWAIVGNWRAHYLSWMRTMGQIGITLTSEDLLPQAYLDVFN